MHQWAQCAIGQGNAVVVKGAAVLTEGECDAGCFACSQSGFVGRDVDAWRDTVNIDCPRGVGRQAKSIDHAGLQGFTTLCEQSDLVAGDDQAEQLCSRCTAGSHNGCTAGAIQSGQRHNGAGFCGGCAGDGQCLLFFQCIDNVICSHGIESDDRCNIVDDQLVGADVHFFDSTRLDFDFHGVSAVLEVEGARRGRVQRPSFAGGIVGKPWWQRTNGACYDDAVDCDSQFVTRLKRNQPGVGVAGVYEFLCASRERGCEAAARQIEYCGHIGQGDVHQKAIVAVSGYRACAIADRGQNVVGVAMVESNGIGIVDLDGPGTTRTYRGGVVFLIDRDRHRFAQLHIGCGAADHRLGHHRGW